MPEEKKFFYNINYTYYDRSNIDNNKWKTIHLGSAGGPWRQPRTEGENKEKLFQLASEWKHFAAGATAMIPSFDMSKLYFRIDQEIKDADVSIEIGIFFEPNKK